MMAVRDDGTVYVTRPEMNDVVALRDINRDGRSEHMFIALANLERVHGIAIHQGQMYLASPKTIYVAPLREDGGVGEAKIIIDNLPDGGQHPNRTLAFGADGLYLSVGSSCNACKETNPEHATVLRVEPDGQSRIIFARGLRNTIGFDWHPQTGQLWGMDHGSDWRGDDQPPEELNRLEQGKDYGWPFCYGNRQVDELLPSLPTARAKRNMRCYRVSGSHLSGP